MEISNTWAPLLVSAIRDAILFQEHLMKSETLRNKSEYEEHHLQLTHFLDYVKTEYKDVEDEAGIPLKDLL